MYRVKTIILFVYVLLMCAFGVSAEPAKPSAPTPGLPMLLTTVGQTQVILHDMQPAAHRLVLEIRHPEVTSMPSKSALHLTFDTQVEEVSKPSTPMPLLIETAVVEQQISLFLARDPFAFPQPWSYLMIIAFDRMPQTGSVTLGALPPQHVTYPSPASNVKTLPGI